MKKLVHLLLLPALVISISTASLAQHSGPTVVKGSSLGKYAKPGAPVDIRYTTQNVEAGENSEVNITLITSVDFGKMYVKIKTDKGLTSVKPLKNEIPFTLDGNSSTYPLQLFMTAEKEGVYYIKLLVAVEGQGARAFAVPVYIGEGRVKKEKVFMEKTVSGESLSVSKAVERRK